ncbi:MAG: hypothetical protein R3344_13705, partial [Acidobacteriota bacterium]|nr:hypothetical protein [Acidobacteriota bacterium]
FAAEDLEGVLATTDWNRSAIEGYYLVGQGAVFTIPLPGPNGLRASGFVGLAAPPVAVGPSAGYSVVVAPDAPAADDSGASAEAESFYRFITPESGLSDEELEKRRAEAEKRRAERERILAEQLAEFESQLAILKTRLIETLGRHGDSLTQVADDEYVTIILAPRSGSLAYFGRQERSAPTREILSVERGTISDYKAGRLSTGAFADRVLQYQN